MNAKITRVEGNSGDWIRLLGSRDGADLSLKGTHLLVAAGRTPNTSGIGLEKAGVETTDRGYVKVNERLQTTAEGVWAIGDCAGSPQFTHISTNDFRVVSDNIAGGNRVTTGRQVPFCMFTDPELARIGLSETEAKRRGIPYRVAKLPVAAVLRAMTISETRGIHEGVDRDGQRPHPRIHHVWRRRWRRHGSRADGDAWRIAVHRDTRRGHRSSHHAGRAYPPLW
jgi:pyruvate/2-oxoglutarate dehydrogenase complex dihydrolipoamide dehydrogenase (E3) component